MSLIIIKDKRLVNQYQEQSNLKLDLVHQLKDRRMKVQ
jgi:hypothetical protein